MQSIRLTTIARMIFIIFLLVSIFMFIYKTSTKVQVINSIQNVAIKLPKNSPIFDKSTFIIPTFKK